MKINSLKAGQLSLMCGLCTPITLIALLVLAKFIDIQNIASESERYLLTYLTLTAWGAIVLSCVALRKRDILSARAKLPAYGGLALAILDFMILALISPRII